MFRLDMTSEPVWLDVADGIRLALKPGGTETITSARRYVRTQREIDPEFDGEFGLIVGCVIWAVTAWEGLGAAEGDDPLPLTAENIVRLLHQRPDIYRVVDQAYVDPLITLLVREKKGSASLPPGISSPPGGLPTAKGAKTLKATPAKPARTSSTPRKRTKAKESGTH